MHEGKAPPPGAAIASAAPPVNPDRLGAREPAPFSAIIPFVRAANRRCLLRRIDALEHLGRDPTLHADDLDGSRAGSDFCCTLAALWDVLGPEAPLYAPARDFATRQILSLDAALERLGVRAVSRPRLGRLEP
jgi:hypothetical protein